MSAHTSNKSNKGKITPAQLTFFTRCIAGVAGSATVQRALGRLSEKEAKRLKDTPVFCESLREFVATQICELSVTNRFADEEAPSQNGYFSGYAPKELTEQIRCLCELFPRIGSANEDFLKAIQQGKVTLPANAEGWFAIPNWMKHPAIFGKTYSEAVQKVFKTIAKSRAFYNHCTRLINEKHLRQSVRSKKFWRAISQAQGNPDILIVAAQSGIRHRGRSVRCVDEIIADTADEFGLGILANAIMLLTHPNRLEHYDGLWINGSGDELHHPSDSVPFDRVLCLVFDKNQVQVCTGHISTADSAYGSPSGFVPKSVRSAKCRAV